MDGPLVCEKKVVNDWEGATWMLKLEFYDGVKKCAKS